MSKGRAIRGQYNKVIGYEVPVLLEGCKTHKAKKLTMIAWYSDCERRRKLKQKQTQCPICGHWYWPDEM